MHLKRKNPGDQLPGGEAFGTKFAMRLEFGKAENDTIPGKIYVCLPDAGRSYVAGTFALKLR